MALYVAADLHTVSMHRKESTTTGGKLDGAGLVFPRDVSFERYGIDATEVVMRSLRVALHSIKTTNKIGQRPGQGSAFSADHSRKVRICMCSVVCW